MTATTRGATPLTAGEHKRRKGWLWLALLALLLLVLAAVLIARRDKSDDDSTSSKPSTTTTSAPATSAPGAGDDAPSTSVPGAGDDAPSTTTGPAGGSDGGAGAVTTVAPGGSGSATSGSVVSGTTPLLPVPSAGLASFAGEDAKGVAAVVESVVADEGFWVGPSATERVFVHLDVPSESRQQVRAGQHVSFTGTVEKLSGDSAKLGLQPGEGKTLLEDQGAYIVADDLSVAG